PLLFPYSNQTYSIDGFNKGDHNMSTFGMLYGSRKTMIRLKFGNFQIAAVEPKTLFSLTSALSGASTVGAYTAPDVEVKIPSIQAKYKYDFDNGHVAVAGGYQTFDLVSGTTTHDVDSYIVGIGGRFDLGAAYFKGNFWGGQNVGNMADILVNGAIFSDAANAAASTLDGDGFGFAQWDGTKVNDRDAYAAMIVAGYAIRKGLYLEAGYGYVKTELDIAGATKDDCETFYIQSTIFLAPGVFLTPEIGRVDMKQADQPVATYYGIKWQINF
ncbi:MAG: porin, partial [Desulfobacteraceae bacterium]|nr:porin [Desulfobacteraceae bacterium]